MMIIIKNHKSKKEAKPEETNAAVTPTNAAAPTNAPKEVEDLGKVILQLYFVQYLKQQIPHQQLLAIFIQSLKKGVDFKGFSKEEYELMIDKWADMLWDIIDKNSEFSSE